MAKATAALAFVAGALAFQACALAQNDVRFPVMTINAGMHVIRAEVAATDPARMQGLMFRKSMGQNEGMLFVFTEQGQHCMWMKNTLVPLSVAFMNERGVIINIEDMAPQTEDSHCARDPSRYALEMSRGWFRQKGIGPGARIEGLDKAPAPR
ncbi:MAG TPA: DUF192 domain-containing protein [Burkholderiales bacterium]|nr:DUF192 domain-containing protein [Burkholderiales bacterium]